MRDKRPDRPKLIRLYWGDHGLPGEWMSFGQIAESLEMEESEVRDLAHRWKLRLRGNWEEAHLLIWGILVDDWIMDVIADFLYRTTVNNRKIDFFLAEEVIGITVKLQSHGPVIVTCRHIGESMMFELTVSNDHDGLQGLGEQVVDILRECDIRKHTIEISRDEGNIW